MFLSPWNSHGDTKTVAVVILEFRSNISQMTNRVGEISFLAPFRQEKSDLN